MKYKVLALLLTFVLIYSCVPVAQAATVTIPDANLNGALHQILGTPASEPITTEQLASITGSVNLSGRSISDIDGVQYLTGVTSLDLSLNSFSSIPRDIENLKALEVLDISGNKLARIPSNLGALTGLKNLDIRANRLTELPSALTKLTLNTFKCDYNFLDVSSGSSVLSTIGQIPAENKYYKDQLLPIKKFSAYSPQSGTITLYWDKMDDLVFDNGVVGHIARYVVLDSDYSYIGEVGGSGNSYEVSGLDPSIEYTFHVGADYYVKGTKYDGTYVKIYKEVTLKAMPLNTATPEISPTETPTASPVPDTATPEPATAAPTIQVITATTAPAPVATEAPSDSGGGRAIYIIIIVLAAIFVFVTLLIILRAIGQRSTRNTRYRR